MDSSGSVKESIGKCTSAKDLWLKLEKAYQDSVINEGKDSPGCNNSKCNDVECSPANEEEDLEVVCVESTNNYLVDEEEDLLKLKDKVIDALEEVSNEIEDDSYTFEDLERITKESLDKYQRHFMALKQLLKKQEGSETTKQRTQLEEKEEEIKRLKNEIISQLEEKKKVDDELRKSLEDLKERKEINVNLKIQLEEAKRIEELLKNQVNEKEESCHKMEAEVVELRRKVEKSKRFMNNSTTLDEILDCQRSPNDKSGLGYNKEATHSEASTSKKHEVSPSYSKGRSKVAIQAPTQSKETFKRT
jgi:chromosome segregation ATPase